MQTKAVIDYIVEWLDNYLLSSGQKGYTVGISGGIDSAVTSTLAAMTGKPLLVIEMPIHQNKDQVNRGKQHIQWLQSKFDNVQSTYIDLTHTYDALVEAVQVDKSKNDWELSLANSRARLRMTTLYYFAGLHRYLVLGTGNKIEDFGVGFFTKYGDGGVDVSPIADLMKSEVYLLAKKLNILDTIQKAKPTDGLFEDNRSDEDQLGATYDELEWAMKIPENQNIEDFENRQKEVLRIYRRWNKAAQHKLNPIPVAYIPKELKA